MTQRVMRPNTNINDLKVVWILGSGFSKPLGGPLLNDFFTKSLERKILTRFENQQVAETLNGIYWHYRDPISQLNRAEQLRQQKEEIWIGAPWTNAEQYIAYLEEALSPSVTLGMKKMIVGHNACNDISNPEQKILSINNLINSKIQRCRRYIAAAVHHFLLDQKAIPFQEAWSPYIRWANDLIGPNDTIISFNYDVVVERLCQDKIQVALPWENSFERKPNKPTLLKLHGSVSFQKQEETDSYVRNDNISFENQSTEYLLSVPGPSKASAPESFEKLWEAAEIALQNADVVVLVGYRFAETDDYAKRRLIQAIEKNNREGLTIRIVLGPQIHSDEIRRVTGLFEWGLSRRGAVEPKIMPRQEEQIKTSGMDLIAPVVLDTVPLYAQDFFAVANRKSLNHWTR